MSIIHRLRSESETIFIVDVLLQLVPVSVFTVAGKSTDREDGCSFYTPPEVPVLIRERRSLGTYTTTSILRTVVFHGSPHSSCP